ncbi:MAG TPA: HEAT repeat domain-containing protein, partial [Allocoleopsis sp.]
VEILTRSKPQHSQEIKTKNDILISALSDQNSNIRLAAINALAHITNHQAEAQLAEIAHRDPDISVRRAALKAIN